MSIISVKVSFVGETYRGMRTAVYVVNGDAVTMIGHMFCFDDHSPGAPAAQFDLDLLVDEHDPGVIRLRLKVPKERTEK